MHAETLPIVDLSRYLANPNEPNMRECRRMWQSYCDLGAVSARDPRFPTGLDGEYLAMMHEYFARRSALKQPDSRRRLDYQFGWAPSLRERAKKERRGQLIALGANPKDLPVQTGMDLKERFFARYREDGAPASRRFPEQNIAPVIPFAFRDRWVDVSNRWGAFMLGTIRTSLEMAAIGAGLEPTAFAEPLYGGQLSSDRPEAISESIVRRERCS